MTKLWSVLLAGALVTISGGTPALADMLPPSPQVRLHNQERMQARDAVEKTLLQKLRAGWTIPLAMKKGIVVDFTINKSGQFSGLKVTESSGSKAIDASAIALIKSIKQVQRKPDGGDMLGTAFFYDPHNFYAKDKIALVIR